MMMMMMMVLCPKAGSLAFTPPGDEMNEVVSSCLPHRQLWVSNLTNEIQWQIRANGKHQVWKAKGRAMDTNTGESPGHQSLSHRLGNSPSEEEMGHWTPMGVEPKDYDYYDDASAYNVLTCQNIQQYLYVLSSFILN